MIVLMASLGIVDSFCPKEKTGEDCLKMVVEMDNKADG